ncbi:MAG: hypothetical protein MRJ67_04645 [Nitrospirales bacterium]|nr:hypothetical protein [Nitrospirales bacterium]
MNSHIPNMLKLLVPIILTLFSACAPVKELPNPDQATAIEQFLITQAVDRSLNNESATPLPLQPEETVTLDTTDLTVEKSVFIGALGQWLGEQGLLLTPEAKHANYRIQVLIQSLGTEQSQSFFGIPPIQSVVIPFALPEIALYKAQYQTGFTRFRLDIFENTTGKFIRSTPWFEATTYFNEYTLFFFFSFHVTNLLGPFNESPSSSTNQENGTGY